MNKPKFILLALLLLPLATLAQPYIITGSGTSFTATRGGATVGIANQPIQTVIDGIKTDAYGEAAEIQFGNGTSELNIGDANINFDGSATVVGGTIILSENFEGDAHNFNLVNSTQTNKWHIGTATAAGGIKSAYISNDNGASNAYTHINNTVHMYADVTFPASSTNYILTFDWKGQGESTYDYLRVYLVETSVTPVAGTQLSSGQIGTTYNLNNSWQKASVNIPLSNAGTTKRLVFSWRNDGSSGTQPPIAVDNITFATEVRGWGQITLSGKIASSNTNTNQAGIYLTNGANVESGANIRKTNTYAIRNNGTGTLTINGGIISATDYAVYNSSTGTVNISGGTISATNSSASVVQNNSTGAINISGGTISAIGTSANAVRNASTGKITISGNANISSANTSASSGTINVVSSGTTTTARLEIIGGTITNTAANGNAVYNASTGSVTFGGNPTITGKIIKAGNGTFNVITEGVNIFAPNGKLYTLDFSTYTVNSTAVVNGGDFLANFKMPPNDYYSLARSSNNLIMVFTGFSYSNTGYVYTITKSATIGGGSGIQAIINAIKTNANGAPCEIQFGNGMEELNIGDSTIQFQNGISSYGPDWGQITLSGKISGKGSYVYYLIANNSLNVESKADVKGATYAIYNGSGANLAISGGIISAPFGVSGSGSTSKITISGNAYISSESTSTTIGTITISDGTLEIIGGTIINTATNGNAVYNSSIGSIILGGNPTITGNISKSAMARNLSVITEGVNVFTPSFGKIYALGVSSYSKNSMVVENGKNFIANFNLAPANGDWGIAVNDNDLVIAFVGMGYAFAKSGTTYTVTSARAQFPNIQDAINAIKADAAGTPCEIRFGSGTEELNIGSANINFDGLATAESSIIIKEDFEGANHIFTIVNGSQTNKWHIGTATAMGSKKSAYISNNNGGSNAYTVNNASTVHMYVDVTFPISLDNYFLTFDWKGRGTSYSDDLRIFLVETSVTLTAGTQVLSGEQLGEATYSGSDNWQKATISIPSSNAGTTKRLVFSWRNDNSSGTQPPIAVDNITLSELRSWGQVTLSGKITSSNTTTSQAGIYLTNGANVDSRADIRKTNTYAIRNNGVGTLTISGGTISSTNYAVYNGSTGTININGGTISSADYAVYNNSAGTINISGGTISSAGTSAYVVLNNSSGTLNISGGTVSATGTSATAVYNSGKITISGVANITSANTGTTSGTIYVNSGTLDIIGGTIINTAAGGRAVYHLSTGSILLGGNPTITGRIMKAGTGNLSVITEPVNIFAPSSGKIYTLDFSFYSLNGMAVENGGNFYANFTFANNNWETLVNNNNLIMKFIGAGYNFAKNGAIYTITAEPAPAQFPYIQGVIDAIKADAAGTNTEIRFGNGTNELNIGTENINFDGSGTVERVIFKEDFEGVSQPFTIVNGTQTNKWHIGTATAAGGTKSAYISNDNGISNAYIITSSSVVHAYVDIAFPGYLDNYILAFNWKGQAESTYDNLKVYLVETSVTPVEGTQLSSGQLGGTYSGSDNWQKATISIPSSNAGTTKRLVFSWVNDNIYGEQPPIAMDNITLSGLRGWGQITLSGKIASSNTNTSQAGIYLTNGASVDSRADIRKTNTYAIRNNGTGTLIINNGTISATDYAVYHNNTNGKTIISGNANISSSGTSTTSGTVYVNNGTLDIIGGTVKNVANSNAVFNASTGSIALGGNPTIIGRIRKAGSGNLSVITEGTNAFAPSDDKVYTLDFSAYSANSMAVVNGSSFFTNFRVPSNDFYFLAKSSNDLVLGFTGFNFTQAGNVYTITKSATIGQGSTIQSVIDEIKVATSGTTCEIQFGNGVDELNIGAENINFNGTAPGWNVMLSGKIASSNTSYTVSLSNGANVESKADIRSTSNYAIQNSGTGTLTISSGTISATNYAVYNSSSGIININGGTVSATSAYAYAVHNNSNGTINISGGAISATGTSANAIYNASSGKITISGNTNITSENSSSWSGTIYTSGGTLEIISGTITNTAANGNAIYNASAGSIALGGNPNITGNIRKNGTGNTSVITDGVNTFVPSAGRIYTLDFSTYSEEGMAVENGRNFTANFALVNNDWGIAINNDNLVMQFTGIGYNFAKSGTTYIITSAPAPVQFPYIQDAINAIRTDAVGEPCGIQFGNGTDELDIGSSHITFDGSNWGQITLGGKIVSSHTSYAIYLSNSVNVESSADIRNTGNYAIYNSSTGILVIIGGTISASSYSIYNGSGETNINGGMISATYGAVYNGSGTINVSGGTMTSTTETIATIQNSSTGNIAITGGTITNTATNGNAISNASSGTIFLGNNPTITGNISGKLNIITEGENAFVPNGKIYSFIFDTYNTPNGSVAVVNGSAFLGSFTLTNDKFRFITDNGDILVEYIGTGYQYSRNGNIYTITEALAPALRIQEVINLIKAEANGADSEIQFGNGADELDIGAASITFDGSGEPGWGKITLSGKITSSTMITLSNGVNVESVADIRTTSSYAIMSGAGIGTLTINGGTISATTNAIHSLLLSGVVKVSGGTISAGNYAVFIPNGSILLDGSPNINGMIRTGNGNLSVTNKFVPNNKVYTLDFSYSAGNMAVVNGGEFLANFKLSRGDYNLIRNSNDLILEFMGFAYANQGNNVYTITKSSTVEGGSSIQAVINAIKADANGAACEIQFGDGTDELGIGETITFDGSGWGYITLSGKISGTGTYTISLGSGVNVESQANIKGSTYAIQNAGDGTLTIRDGVVSASTYSIMNSSIGTVNVINGTILGQINIYNYSTGTVNISGGMISSTTSVAVVNYSTGSTGGTINISGGTISSTAGTAISNQSPGSIILSGNPTIIGNIYKTATAGNLVIDNAFAPGSKTYTLDFPAYEADVLAVENGKNFLANFKLADGNWALKTSGDNLVITTAEPADPAELACIAEGKVWENNACRNKTEAELCTEAGNNWVSGQCKTDAQLAQETCLANGRVWENNACRDKTEAELCTDAGNNWVSGQCKTDAQLVQETCLANGRVWENNACRDKIEAELCTDAGNNWVSGQCKTEAQLAQETCLADSRVWENDSCRDKTEAELCIEAGDNWIDGQCKMDAQLDQETCLANGKVWESNACRNKTEAELCTEAGNNWVSGQCKTDAQLVQETCLANGRVWENNACRDKTEAELCTDAGNNWVSGQCKTEAQLDEELCLAEGRVWENNSCRNKTEAELCAEAGNNWVDGQCKTPTQIGQEAACIANGNVWENNQCTTPTLLPQIAAGKVRVSAIGKTIALENVPAGAKVGVYNAQGKLISSKSFNQVNQGSDNMRIPVQTKGIYIVKIGNQTLRVAVR